MFKDAGFYIMWAIFSMFPLTIAIFSPDKIRTKIIAALCVLAVTFGIMVIMYKQAVVLMNQLRFRAEVVSKIIIILVTLVGIQKNLII